MPTLLQFPLPDAGEGLTEAEIVEWRVAPGDAVTVNQVLVEIETAKSLVELPSPWAGVVTTLLVTAGDTVPVGTPIVEIDTDPDGSAPAAPAPAAAPTPATAPASSSASLASSSPAPSATPTTPGFPEGSGADHPAELRKAEREGDDEPTGDGGGAVLVGYGVAAAGVSRRARGATGGAGGSSPAATPPAGAGSSGGHALAKPPVRKLARDLGLDLDVIAGTGPGGIVTREDVLALAARAQARELATYPGDESPWLASGTVTADGRQTRVPVRSVRKRTAEAMVASAFTAPHVTVFHTVDVTRTMKLVEKLRADREFADVRVTPLLIAAKALLLAVRRHPEINASWDDDAQEIVYKHYVNLGIAAATPRGLVVPNVKDAHRLGLLGLARGLAELTANARAGTTSPTDTADGTITITNVGVFGIDTGTPILNPGEAAILAFGAIRLQPWVHKGRIKPRHVTQLALSFDHRLVDGELGSRVLADVAAVLQDPAHALVWG